MSSTNILSSISSILFEIGFVFCPSIGFILQYLKIKRLNSSYGFSKLIPLILFIAYIFRIFFWIGKRFEMNILLQAIVGILVQLILIKACVEYTNEYKDKTNSDLFSLKDFWNWPYFLDYFGFVFLLSIFLGLSSNLIGYDKKYYIEILGAISAVSESLIGWPQIWENYNTQNVKTLSYPMILFWIVGDCFKTSYYIFKNSPTQLILCGFAQICGDFIIIGQIYYYSKKQIEITVRNRLRGQVEIK
jgi:hypothetical protein